MLKADLKILQEEVQEHLAYFQGMHACLLTYQNLLNDI